MRSPVVIGMKPATAEWLPGRTPDRQTSWADVADAAADGSLTFAMDDPRQTNQVPQRTFSARCLGKVQDWNAEDAVLEVQAMAIFR